MALTLKLIYLTLLIIFTVVVNHTYGIRYRGRSSRNTNVFKKPSSTTWRHQNRAAMCLKGDCYPETGDLLVGRTKFLHASSTCGLEDRGPERYCVLGTTRDQNVCDYCDSSEPYDPTRNITNSHMIENIVSRKQGDRFNRWWQSENGKQNVYIQFDLEAEFAFTHIIMTFKTFRPAAMIIEKSSDFGRTWKTYGYFAANCAEAFPGIPTDLPKNLGELYCESRYSSVTPSTKGEVVFRILPPTLIQSRDPYSTDVQDLLKITNLRINFTQLHTFGDNLLDSREDLKEKYYYSMYEMVVRGSCLCYGHASRCIPVEGVQYDLENNGMVEGQCQCMHNTMGTNCEECLPLFNDRPWKPARRGTPNECKMCQCHNHASTCTFNQIVYEQSNETSGGVCNDCQHNTMGIHCENCKPNFWRDPERGIDDPYSCKPCMCDLSGSLNDAKCDPYQDEENGLVAGQCHCKPLVEGQNCDRCKNGYFNLTTENPNGCEPCSCNTIGTTGNLGCDKDSGLCSCKRYVTGRACDQCLPGYYGLSDDPDGCKPCNCALGGSHDMYCDVNTGQCNCKNDMTGRTCEKPKDGFFCPLLDHFVYEAEDAEKLDQRSIDLKRPIYGQKTWSGTGFVRVFESSLLEFNINQKRIQPFKSGHYEIVLRYELQNGIGWNDIRVMVERETPPSGFCAKSSRELNLSHRIEPQTTYSIVQAPVCLEASQSIKVTLVFDSQGAGLGRDASILIDSILLIPVIDELPSLQGPNNEKLRIDFERFSCKRAQINLYEDIPVECEKFLCNIGIHNEGYAQPCDCDATGSTSSVCDWRGGSCECRTNIDGRQCSECAVSTYGFGPNGCQSCNCNAGGAKNDFCDKETGQCDCYDRVKEKHCDQCQLNFWKFPTCEPCQCNGFADYCNQTTGECINCQHHTYGYHCEMVEDGWYWPSGLLVPGEIPKECQCPGNPSGNQFADKCYFDKRIDGIVCNCQEGYVGYRCDQCAINYYGNPTERGGSCKMCQCNNNTDIYDPESCDQETGICKKCRFNTDGDNCEKCLPGYYGNALNHDCKPCDCYPHGTEENSPMNCDQTTGQCNCLPNVVGMQCDMCEEDHFGLHTGTGCEPCDCDLVGTMNSSTTCDRHTGQCMCLESRGGRTCSDCKDDYWGNPTIECTRCECTPHGSKSSQCDKNNGSCLCKKGITGYNCDRCDRGTTGNIPYCTPCGECFDDWSNVLDQLKVQLEELEIKASNLAVASGSTIKDFTAEYNQLEGRLKDIKKILGVDYNDNELSSLSAQLALIENHLEFKKAKKAEYLQIEEWAKENEKIRSELANSNSNYTDLKVKLNKLRDRTIDLIESNTEGATNSITKAGSISDTASLTLQMASESFDRDLKPLIDQLQQKLDDHKEQFNNKKNELSDYYTNLSQNLTNALGGVSDLNLAVCGGITSNAEKCSPICGGSDCNGQCGTNISQCNGLVDAYWKVVTARQNFLELYNKQESAFKRILTKLHRSNIRMSVANADVERLLKNTNSSLQIIAAEKKRVEDLTQKVDEFSINNSEKPSKIESTCDAVITKEITINEQDFEDILSKINKLASNTNVNQIDDIRIEKANSEYYLNAAESSKESIQNFIKSLDEVTEEYNVVKNESNSAVNSFDLLQDKINEAELSVVNSQANDSAIKERIKQVEESIEELKISIRLQSNEMYPNNIAKQESLKSKVKESGVTLLRTKQNLDSLEIKYNELFELFKSLIDDDKGDESSVLNSLISLQTKINQKKNEVDQKSSRIKSLTHTYEDTRGRIVELRNTLQDLKATANLIREDIRTKEQYFNQCG